ncbi:MAG TPA: type II toxin-antitoxin system ParD family antitoxin [Microvirga sp.]|jgi:antitoxin ParD1/3/4|nr:type II toxin-antitoxin system ParD family antitoxin [Microvirga sp.]
MPTDQTRNVSLTAELNAFICAQVASGQYQNASEVVRAGLRLLLQQVGPGDPQMRLPADGSQTPRAPVRGRHARQV